MCAGLPSEQGIFSSPHARTFLGRAVSSGVRRCHGSEEPGPHGEGVPRAPSPSLLLLHPQLASLPIRLPVLPGTLRHSHNFSIFFFSSNLFPFSPSLKSLCISRVVDDVLLKFSILKILLQVDYQVFLGIYECAYPYEAMN